MKKERQELITFHHVTYRYEERIALADCTVSLYAGEKVAVLGNNGAGKSTFFLLCNGILKPETGSISFNGQTLDYRRKSLNQLRHNIGLVFQDPEIQLIAGTVQEEISFGPINLGWDAHRVQQQVTHALQQFDLYDLRERAPQFLSGGEKKRVTLADVFAMEPKLILLDEPASSLDPHGRRLLEYNLEQLAEAGIGLVISTHDVDFAWRWAQRVLLFHNGRLVADTIPEQAFMQQDLLEQCGLESPMLCQVSHMLGLEKPIHTMEELKSFIKESKINKRFL